MVRFVWFYFNSPSPERETRKLASFIVSLARSVSWSIPALPKLSARWKDKLELPGWVQRNYFKRMPNSSFFCTMDQNVNHRVVISGIAGRFPNSSNVAEFQKNLLNKVDCTTTDHGRWDIGNKSLLLVSFVKIYVVADSMASRLKVEIKLQVILIFFQKINYSLERN